MARRRGGPGGAALVALALVVVATLAGCGGGSSVGGKVAVRLTDYDVILSTSSVGAGKVEFAVSNTGSFVHEILLVRSDLAIDKLPKATDGRFDETSPQVKVLAAARSIPPGGSSALVGQLARGSYYLICNRPAEPGDTMSHFQHGMLAAFTVT